MPPTASEYVGENEVASKQRGEVPLVEQEVVSGQRHTRQEPDLMARMTVMLKDLEQEVCLLKEGRTQEIRDNIPPAGNQDKRRVSSGRESQPPILNTGRCQFPPRAIKGKTLGDP